MNAPLPPPAPPRSLGVLAAASLAFWAALSAGCAEARPPEAASPARAPAAEAAPIELRNLVVSPFSDAELEEQFEAARALLAKERYREAVERFDRLARLAPDGEVGGPSLYNAALSYEGLGQRDLAVARYEELLARHADLVIARGAPFRLSRLYAYLERWKDLSTNADRMLARTDLSVLESIEAHGAKSLALVELDQADLATREARLAEDLIEQNHLGESGAPPVELAQVRFAVGELRKKKSEKIGFDPLPPNFADVLEQRCQGLLDAQSAYTDAMRSLDAHWSAMAGYRVGQLYQRLHRDVMAIGPTAKSDTVKKQQLFEGAMRLRYRVLLEKGLKMMEGTVRLGGRTGEDSAWVKRAEEAKRDIELAIEDEKRALAKLPYSEAELKEALELLRNKK